MAGFVVMGLGLAALGTGPAFADDQPPVRCQQVGVIGGSITVGSIATQGQEFLDLGISNYRIDAKIGRQITRKNTGGISVLAKWRKSGYDPDCLVIALGTNDIPYYNTPSIYGGWIDQMMVAIGPVPKVLWVNVYRGKSRWRDELFNGELQKRVDAGTYPNLQIADWSSFIAAHLSWLSKDGVHPVGKGLRGHSRWVAEQVWDKLNGGGPPVGPPPATCTVATVPLKYGMKNVDVLCLEQRLRQLLYFTGKADTKFDYTTKRIVSTWQGAHGLTATGVVDETTRDALGLAPPPPPPPPS